MKRRSYYLRIAIVIGINIVLLTALSFLVGGDVKAITPVYVNPGGDDTSCNGSLPGSTPPNCAVKTIQKGVELVDAGGTISVAVGTYTETVMITKPLTLLGAQADTIPTDASERAGGESIIRPDASHPYTSSLILVLSDFVTIRGFFLDGNNPTLGSSGESSNGVDLHVAGAIANGIDQYGQAPPFTPSDYSNPIDNLTVSRNIIKNVNHHGVALVSGSAFARGDNLITENFFDNVQGTTPNGAYIHRRAIWLGQSQYASIINNRFTRVRWGIHVNQFTQANPGAAVTISGNQVACNRSCVRLGSFSGTSSPYSIISNTVSGASLEGLSLSSINITQPLTVTNNSVTGNGRNIVFSGATSVNIHDNDLSGYTTSAINNQTPSNILDASGNWWGNLDPSGSIEGVDVDVDYTPWLNSGTNNSTGSGFLGDFSSLTVDDLSSQTGTQEPIEEGLSLVTPGGELFISAGDYNEAIDLNQDTDIFGSGDISLVGGLTIQQNSFVAPTGTLALTGDFELSGGTFTANGGTVLMNGSSAQTIGGTSSAIFSSLSISNTSGVSLGIGEALTGTLTLTNGLFTLDAYTLTMGNAAGVAGTFTGINMIVADGAGQLCKQFDQTGAFTYPLGDNTGTAEYSPASLSFSSGTFGTGAQACLNLRNVKLPGHNSPDHIERYWTLDTSGITSFSSDVTFNYVDADIVGVEGNLFTSKKDGNVWTAGNAADTANNELSMNGINSFSDFTGKSDPTAVTLASFEAAGFNGYVMITWETLLELDMLGYNIYRSTTLEGERERVNPELIPIAIGSIYGNSYSFYDTSVQLGDTYYYWLEVVGIYGPELTIGPVSTTIFEYIYLPVVTR